MHPPTEPRLVQVSHEADVILARQVAVAIGRDIGFDRNRSHALATAVSELASNLVSHARYGGEVRLSAVVDGQRTGVEIVCSDDGPGIADIKLALTEGFSSSGGLGGGLSGVSRLVDDFHISSTTGDSASTVIRAILWRPRC